jgi:hypothetical protein
LFLSDHTLYGSARLGQRQQNNIVNQNYVPPGTHNLVGVTYVQRGWKAYELSNHLGNVLSVISDRKEAGHCNDTLVAFYYPDIIQNNDYYPFGSPMEGRGQQTKNYRFGFNGQERDNEVYGDGNSYTAEFWQYDPRLGRRWNVDKFASNYPFQSPYVSYENSPIWLVDINGDSTTYFWRGEIIYVSHDGLPNAIVTLNLNEIQMIKFKAKLNAHLKAGTADSDAANQLGRSYGVVYPVKQFLDFYNGKFSGTLVGEEKDYQVFESGAYLFVENNIVRIGDQYTFGEPSSWDPGGISEKAGRGLFANRRMHTHPIAHHAFTQKFISDNDGKNHMKYESEVANVTIDRDYMYFSNPNNGNRSGPFGFAVAKKYMFDKRTMEHGSDLWGNLSEQKLPGVKEQSPENNLRILED